MLVEPKTCRVSFPDREGLEHSVQVLARSRNEAAVRALARFRRLRSSEFASILGPYRSDKLTVRIVNEESHDVTVSQAEEWLERHGTPSEMALKHELRGLLEAS